MKDINGQNHIHHFDITEIFKWIMTFHNRDYSSLFAEVRSYINSDPSHTLRLPYPEVVFDFHKSKNIFVSIKAREDINGDNIKLTLSNKDDEAEFRYELFYKIKSSSESDFSHNYVVKVLSTGKEFILKEEERVAYQTKELLLEYIPVIYALIFMNFRNSEFIEEPAAREKRKWNSLNRGHKKIVYKLIVLRHKKKYYRIKDAFAREGDSNSPLTNVRSCTKTYRYPNLFMGKIEADIFVPAHKRGNKDNGENINDYVTRLN